MRQGGGSCHHHVHNNTPGCNPCLRVLKSLCEVTNIIRQLPRGVNALPVQRISLEGINQQRILQAQWQPTYMIQLPNCMPAHHSDEVAGNVIGVGCEMGLGSHQVISHCARYGCLHAGREKLDWRAILVSQPQYHPAIIGRTQVLIVVHGPWMPSVEAPVHWKTSKLPASQGLSTLGGGTVMIHSPC